MNTMTEAPRVRTTYDRTARVVVNLDPEKMRDFMLQLAFLTQGACYDDATIESGMSLSLERQTGMLLAKQRVDGMSGYSGFDDGARQTEVFLHSDDSQLDWRVVDENVLRRAATTYRPDPGVWMSFSFLPRKGVWCVDMQLISQGGSGTAEAEDNRAMRVGVYRALCERIVSGTYATSLDIPASALRSIPREYAEIYRELVDKWVKFTG